MMATLASRDLRRLTPISIAVAVWGMGYALYRGYYALGGTVLLPGTPADPTQFRLINAAAVAILAIAAVLPIAMLPLWRRPWFLLEGLGYAAIGWIALGPGGRRRWWVGSAIVATLVLTVIGLLSATGVIGKV